MKNSPKADPAFDKFFARIPPEIATSFTDAQLNAIKQVFSSTSVWGSHAVDIRLSLPLPGRRFYFVMLAGPERRSSKRLRAQRIHHQVWTPVNILVIAVFLLLLLTSVFTVSYGVLNMSQRSLVVCEHPTSIPWISNQDECENSGRTWRNGECLDFEHSPNF